MTAHCVFRVGKLKSAAKINAAGGHNARSRETPNADPRRANLVFGAQPAGSSLHDAVLAQIGGQRIRKNAVLAVEVIVSASPEYFRPGYEDRAGEWDEDRLRAWQQAVEPWIKKNFPNAAQVVLHLDEVTPHFQIVDVPLDERGKLNCRGKYGGRAKLAKWQSSVADAVEHLGIERGIPKSAAKHVDIKEFYGRINRPTPENQPFPQIKAKSNIHDLSERRRREAESTAIRLARENDELRAQLREHANRLRKLDLHEVLDRMYGAKEILSNRAFYRQYVLNNGHKYSLSQKDRSVWIDESANAKGRNAIDLVMRVDDIAFPEAVARLAHVFGVDDTARDYMHAVELDAAGQIGRWMVQYPQAALPPAVAAAEPPGLPPEPEAPGAGLRPLKPPRQRQGA